MEITDSRKHELLMAATNGMLLAEQALKSLIDLDPKPPSGIEKDVHSLSGLYRKYCHETHSMWWKKMTA